MKMPCPTRYCAYIQRLPEEKTGPFQKTLKEVIREIIFETSQFACWLYEAIYTQGISATQLILEHPESEELILFMDQVFKDLKRGDFEGN